MSDTGSSGVDFTHFQVSLEKKKKEARSHMSKAVGKDPRITTEQGIINQDIGTE